MVSPVARSHKRLTATDEERSLHRFSNLEQCSAHLCWGALVGPSAVSYTRLTSMHIFKGGGKP